MAEKVTKSSLSGLSVDSLPERSVEIRTILGHSEHNGLCANINRLRHSRSGIPLHLSQLLFRNWSTFSFLVSRLGAVGMLTSFYTSSD